MNTTRYKLVDGFPGYRIGDDGSVWSRWTLATAANGSGWQRRQIGVRWVNLKGGRDRDGYRKVILCDGAGKRRHARVHRLVLEAFVGPQPPGMASAHANGKRDDNRLVNLRWSTQTDNCADKIVCGTSQRGEKHPMAKLTEESVRTIRHRRAAGEALGVLADEYGVLKSAICAVATRRTWKHVP